MKGKSIKISTAVIALAVSLIVYLCTFMYGYGQVTERLDNLKCEVTDLKDLVEQHLYQSGWR